MFLTRSRGKSRANFKAPNKMIVEKYSSL